MINKVKQSWDNCSDDYYHINASEDIINRIIENPKWAIPPQVWDMLNDVYPDLKGKRILVPSSGDNGAVFAFHLLGAQVTSTDISEKQLLNAKRIADYHGWEIDFICTDSMKLDSIKNNNYDLVYTSNGVHVWISDLSFMYANIKRVLKDGGHYLMFETHPFIRPFLEDEKDIHNIQIAKQYEDIGPFGDLQNYSWRICDILNGIINAELTIRRTDEFHPEKGAHDLWWYKTLAEAESDNNMKFDWIHNPWAALPQWIGVFAIK